MERINKTRLLSKIRFSRNEKRKIFDKIHFSLDVLFLEYTFVNKIKRGILYHKETFIQTIITE